MASRSKLKVTNRPEPARAWSPPVRANRSAEGKVSSICVDLSDLRPDDAANVKLRLEGDTLTITGYRIVPADPPQAKMARNPDGSPRPAMVTEQQDFAYEFSMEARRSPETLEAHYNPLQQELNINVLTELDEILIQRGGVLPWREGEPFPIEIVSPEPEPLVPPPVSPYTPELEKPPHELRMVEDDRIITKERSRQFPISLAAHYAKVPRTTLVDWITNKTLFAGEPLQTYYSPTAKKLYLAEESVERVIDRFIKWRSGKPAGPAGAVTIGQKRDKTGYIGITRAARTLRVDHHTMWLWTAHETAPIKDLDVIQDSASKQFYIREADISRLKKLIPRSGLKRGPRPQLAIT